MINPQKRTVRETQVLRPHHFSGCPETLEDIKRHAPGRARTTKNTRKTRRTRRLKSKRRGGLPCAEEDPAGWKSANRILNSIDGISDSRSN